MLGSEFYSLERKVTTLQKRIDRTDDYISRLVTLLINNSVTNKDEILQLIWECKQASDLD